jgi:hypothetical protein
MFTMTSRRRGRLGTVLPVWRGIRGASLLVVALCVAGCGAKVDLSKVTYTRTTVPPAGRTATSGPPKTNDSAFTSAKLREIDACALLDKDTLAKVGTPDENDVIDFGRCSNFMKDLAGKDLSISVTLGEGLLEDPADADKNIGGLPAIESELDDKSACFETAITETSPNRGIKVQTGGKAANMCDIGRTVLAAVVNRIRADPPRYDTKPGSLVPVDPCAQLGDADVTAVLGAGAKITPTNLHWCDWSLSGAEIWVWFRSGVDPAKSVDAGKTQKVDIAGVSGFQETDTSSGAKCSVEWAHLPLTGSLAEVVNVTFIRYTAQQGEDVCGKAQAIARTLVPKLPKS